MWRGGFIFVYYSLTFFKHPQKLSVWSWFREKIPYIPPHFLMVGLILNPTQLLNTSGLLTSTENLIYLYNFVFPLISLSVEDPLIFFCVFSLIFFFFKITFGRPLARFCLPGRWWVVIEPLLCAGCGIPYTLSLSLYPAENNPVIFILTLNLPHVN